MTRKDLVLGLVRYLGFNVIKYKSGNWESSVVVTESPDEVCPIKTIRFKSRKRGDLCTLRIWWSDVDFPGGFKIDTYRKVQAYLHERGFEAVADWKLGKGIYIRTGYSALWKQCAEPMTNLEAFDNAMTTRSRYRGVAIVG